MKLVPFSVSFVSLNKRRLYFLAILNPETKTGKRRLSRKGPVLSTKVVNCECLFSNCAFPSLSLEMVGISSTKTFSAERERSFPTNSFVSCSTLSFLNDFLLSLSLWEKVTISFANVGSGEMKLVPFSVSFVSLNKRRLYFLAILNPETKTGKRRLSRKGPVLSTKVVNCKFSLFNSLLPLSLEMVTISSIKKLSREGELFFVANSGLSRSILSFTNGSLLFLSLWERATTSSKSDFSGEIETSFVTDSFISRSKCSFFLSFLPPFSHSRCVVTSSVNAFSGERKTSSVPDSFVSCCKRSFLNIFIKGLIFCISGVKKEGKSEK